MQWFFRFLTLVGLAFAPLAAPSVAMTQHKPTAAACKQMDMGTAEHRMPTAQHRAGEACCVAIPPAIDPPATALGVAPLIDHPTFIGATVTFRLGASPSAEDPPPRIT